MKDHLLGDSFDVDKEGTGVSDISFLVEGSVSVPGADRFLKLRDGETLFFNEVVVNAGDVCTTVNKGIGVDGFQGVRRYDELQRNSHRFASHRYRYRRTSSFWGCSRRSRFPF